jgi:general stress protein 26
MAGQKGDASMSESKQDFLSMLQKFDNGILVTHTPDGELRGRPMAVADADEDGGLWFATGSDTGKVDEIAHDARVLVTMQSPTRYLTIRGRAELVRDRSKVDQLWNDAWRLWFDQGKDDPRLVLLHVRAEEAEYWDRSGLRGLKYAFKAVRSYAKGERATEADQDQHGKVRL